MKKIIFHKVNGGGAYQAIVYGDKNKETWGKIDGKTFVDDEVKAIKIDATADGYKIIVK